MGIGLAAVCLTAKDRNEVVLAGDTRFDRVVPLRQLVSWVEDRRFDADLAVRPGRFHDAAFCSAQPVDQAVAHCFIDRDAGFPKRLREVAHAGIGMLHEIPGHPSRAIRFEPAQDLARCLMLAGQGHLLKGITSDANPRCVVQRHVIRHAHGLRQRPLYQVFEVGPVPMLKRPVDVAFHEPVASDLLVLDARPDFIHEVADVIGGLGVIRSRPLNVAQVAGVRDQTAILVGIAQLGQAIQMAAAGELCVRQEGRRVAGAVDAVKPAERVTQGVVKDLQRIVRLGAVELFQNHTVDFVGHGAALARDPEVVVEAADHPLHLDVFERAANGLLAQVVSLHSLDAQAFFNLEKDGPVCSVAQQTRREVGQC